MSASLANLFQRLPQAVQHGHHIRRWLSASAVRATGSNLPSRTPPPPGLITVEGTEDLSVVSGHPAEEIQQRQVRIYQPAKNAMQSGTHNIHNWNLDFDTQERWENPLMGWASTGDPLSNVQLTFHSAQEAVEFCERNGWTCYVDQRSPVKPKVKSYGANFAWNRNTRTSTK